MSYALLALLEQLPPAERTAFVLHDVFDVPFPEVADVVGRTPEAVRQLASRARRHVAAGRPRRPASAAQHRRLVEAFARAAGDGDLEALASVLDPDVVFTADGGGLAIAARRPLRGATRVARAWILITGKASATARRELVGINDRAGLLIDDPDGSGRTALAFTVDGGRITRIDVMRNPAKLHRLAAYDDVKGSPNDQDGDMSPEILRYAAFTDDPAGGNPAGVVLDATGLDAAAMLAIAADVGYSETAFVLRRADGTLDVRYFSPLAEVPFCGHATIATAVAWAERHGGGVLTMRTPAGDVRVEVLDGAPPRATLTSVPPRIGEVDAADVAEALAALGWSADALDPRSRRGSPTRARTISSSPPPPVSASPRSTTTSSASAR